eukprot:5094694-Amphidinium_carterae.1
MARFAHLPAAVAEEAPPHRGRGKRHRSISPTEEERNLSGPGPSTLPFGHPPTEEMYEAAAASVRKEQAT